MNASETSLKGDVRLGRISNVSRIAKYMCFGVIAFYISHFIFFTRLMSSPPVPASVSVPGSAVSREILLVVFQILLCFWYWRLSRLVQCYERGMIFTSESIRCIKILGLLWLAGWLILTGVHFLPHSTYNFQPVAHANSAGAIVASPVSVQRVDYRMGFFTFDFGTGINFGPLLAGSIIVIVSWVMDEGRKMREEQELTV